VQCDAHCNTLQHTTTHSWCSTDASRRHRNAFPHTRHISPHTRPIFPPKHQGYNPQYSVEFRSVRSTVLGLVRLKYMHFRAHRETYAISHSSRPICPRTRAIIVPKRGVRFTFSGHDSGFMIHGIRPCFAPIAKHIHFRTMTPYISTCMRCIFQKRSICCMVLGRVLRCTIHGFRPYSTPVAKHIRVRIHHALYFHVHSLHFSKK